MKHTLSNMERFIWGDCPVCHAPHGEPCHSEIGFSIGRNVKGEPPNEGAHLGRLEKAPFEIHVDLYAQLLLKRFDV